MPSRQKTALKHTLDSFWVILDQFPYARAYIYAEFNELYQRRPTYKWVGFECLHNTATMRS